MYDLFGLDDPAPQLSVREHDMLEHYRMLDGAHKYVVDELMDSLLTIEDSRDIREIRKLTFFEKSLAAGIGDPTEFEDEGTPIFLYASKEVDRADYVFTVNGDSMLPHFHSGDLVLVRKNDGGINMEYGEIGAFVVGNETYIKIYEEDGLNSFNKKYKPIHFAEEEQVFLIGKVVSTLPQDEIASEDDVDRYRGLYPGVLN